MSDNQIMLITLKEYTYFLKCKELAEMIYNNTTPQEFIEFLKDKKEG